MPSAKYLLRAPNQPELLCSCATCATTGCPPARKQLLSPAVTRVHRVPRQSSLEHLGDLRTATMFQPQRLWFSDDQPAKQEPMTSKQSSTLSAPSNTTGTARHYQPHPQSSPRTLWPVDATSLNQLWISFAWRALRGSLNWCMFSFTMI